MLDGGFAATAARDFEAAPAFGRFVEAVLEVRATCTGRLEAEGRVWTEELPEERETCEARLLAVEPEGRLVEAAEGRVREEVLPMGREACEARLEAEELERVEPAGRLEEGR